jgi:hypothetical protein
MIAGGLFIALLLFYMSGYFLALSDVPEEAPPEITGQPWDNVMSVYWTPDKVSVQVAIRVLVPDSSSFHSTNYPSIWMVPYGTTGSAEFHKQLREVVINKADVVISPYDGPPVSYNSSPKDNPDGDDDDAGGGIVLQGRADKLTPEQVADRNAKRLACTAIAVIQHRFLYGRYPATLEDLSKFPANVQVQESSQKVCIVLPADFLKHTDLDGNPFVYEPAHDGSAMTLHIKGSTKLAMHNKWFVSFVVHLWNDLFTEQKMGLKTPALSNIHGKHVEGKFWTADSKKHEPVPTIPTRSVIDVQDPLFEDLKFWASIADIVYGDDSGVAKPDDAFPIVCKLALTRLMGVARQEELMGFSADPKNMETRNRFIATQIRHILKRAPPNMPPLTKGKILVIFVSETRIEDLQFRLEELGFNRKDVDKFYDEFKSDRDLHDDVKQWWLTKWRVLPRSYDWFSDSLYNDIDRRVTAHVDEERREVRSRN